MADYRTMHRSALAGHRPVGGGDVLLTPLPEGHVLQLLGITDRSKVPTPPGASKIYDGGAGQWYVVGDEPLSRQALAKYFAALPKGAHGVDQSHGRVRIRVAGRKAELALAKGTGVDLTAFAFPVGYATTTLFGHIAAYVARTDTSTFELMVLRGFAESLWDDLVRMSLEFT
jgi:sarcosine oxidase subunit gamma